MTDNVFVILVGHNVPVAVVPNEQVAMELSKEMAKEDGRVYTYKEVSTCLSVEAYRQAKLEVEIAALEARLAEKKQQLDELHVAQQIKCDEESL